MVRRTGSTSRGAGTVGNPAAGYAVTRCDVATFGTFEGIGPIPGTDAVVTTPSQLSIISSLQASQPITQLFKLNLNVALTEASKARAEEQLREALKRNSSLPTAHMYLGLCLVRTNKYDEAEKELLLAIQGSGNQLGLAQYYLGGIYWRKKDYPKAIAALEDYLRLTPNAPDAERVRATIKDLRNRTP